MQPEEQEAVLGEIEAEEERRRAREEREREKVEARAQKQESKAKKQKALREKQRALLASAFASDDEGNGNSSGSEWFEADLQFDGSDDEGL